MLRASFKSLLLVLLALTLIVSGTGASQAQEAKSITISVLSGDDVDTIDPILAGNTVYSVQVANMLFPGMTVLNETTVAVEPGIAESWTVDGATFTFKLIPQIPWVRYDAASGKVVEVTDADGKVRYVTAADVVFGIKRALDPATGSPYSYVLAPAVEGGDAAAGAGEDREKVKAALEAVGVRAVDEYTVEIKGTGNYAYLPNIYGMWMARPVPAWAIEAGGEKWTEPENINTYGPFALKAWAHDDSITFVKNPFWKGTASIPAPKLDEIVNRFLDGSAALAEYEAGNLVYIGSVPSEDIERIKASYPDQFEVGPGQCTLYYAFNNEKEPFTDARMRRAFSLGIDRQTIVAAVTGRGEVPAAFFTRPEMVAAPKQENSTLVAPLLAAATEREAAAKAELEAYLKEKGLTVETLPAITLTVTKGNETLAEAIQEMWRKSLGITVELSVLERQAFNALRSTDAPQIYRASWCYDYPDANNWTFEVFRSDNGFAEDGGNEPNYKSAEFDKLVAAAREETDVEKRRALYQQAEELLAWTDAAIAPIYYFSTTLMKNPKVERPFSNTGYESFEKWDVRR